MNYRKLGNVLGKIMILEGILMIIPLTVSLIYREDSKYQLAFAIPIILLALLGFLLTKLKPKRNSLYQKEGFALTALIWFIMTLFGALPFVINGDIPNYIDACFEIASGFTTTGASILPDVTQMSHSTLFWRSFSHWIGGMGILVFVLMFIPEGNDGSSLHLLRAESPGPQVGKITTKMKATARNLYLIYIALTVAEFCILMFDKPIAGYENDKIFINLLTTFGSAGTGGFGILPGSIELFNPFSQYVIAIFLILFGANFTLYYLILLGKIKDVVKSEELRSYFAIITIAISISFVGLIGNAGMLIQSYTTEEVFRHSLFQVASIMTTTGYSTTDFAMWPVGIATILIILMFIGGMAGSTAGGLKVSRIVFALKGSYINVRKTINPRYVPKTKFEGKTIEKKTLNDVFVYITLYAFILLFVVLTLSFDPINGTTSTIMSDAGTYEVTHGFASNFSAAVSCMSNIGPGIEAVGPYASFAGYSIFSKGLLTIVMILGRLEILPVLVLFNKRTWERI